MTIAAAYLSSDGVVLGADSTTTITVRPPDQEESVVQIFNHAQKLFEIGPAEEGSFALCTWGAGTIGDKSHRTIAAELSEKIEGHTSVEEAKDELNKIVIGSLKDAEHKDSGVGYFLAGCNQSQHKPECWSLYFENGELKDSTQLAIGEARFQGAPEFFTRVFYGYDDRLPGLLAQELQDKGIENKAFHEAFSKVAAMLPAVGFNDLPIREAIDYINTYLHITIKANKFRYGPPICGGAIEIGFITTDRKFRWVRHKDFDSAIREAEGGYYV